jgi:C-terminal processing protease CtpA/Prc
MTCVLIPKRPAGPADLSRKLKAGDRLLSVNGTSIVDLSLDEITRLFPGPVGSPVFVAIDTGTMIRTVEVMCMRKGED